MEKSRAPTIKLQTINPIGNINPAYSPNPAPISGLGGFAYRGRVLCGAPGHAEVLAFRGAIPAFTLAADAERILQGVVGLAHVETDLGASLHVGIGQPVDDEERPFYPTDFSQGRRQFMLSGIGCELPQELARRHGP